MSTVLSARVSLATINHIQPDSLLEYLYTYFGVDQLNELLAKHPGEPTLKMWDVSLQEYKLQVRTAIEFVIRD